MVQAAKATRFGVLFSLPQVRRIMNPIKAQVKLSSGIGRLPFGSSQAQAVAYLGESDRDGFKSAPIYRGSGPCYLYWHLISTSQTKLLAARFDPKTAGMDWAAMMGDGIRLARRPLSGRKLRHVVQSMASVGFTPDGVSESFEGDVGDVRVRFTDGCFLLAFDDGFFNYVEWWRPAADPSAPADEAQPPSASSQSPARAAAHHAPTSDPASSYALGFWKYGPDAVRDHQQTYERLSDGQGIDGLEKLPIRELIEGFKRQFPDWRRVDDATWQSDHGRFQVFTTSQFFCVDCYGMDWQDMNKIMEVAEAFDCPLYDPQTDEWFGRRRP